MASVNVSSYPRDVSMKNLAHGKFKKNKKGKYPNLFLGAKSCACKPLYWKESLFRYKILKEFARKSINFFEILPQRPNSQIWC